MKDYRAVSPVSGISPSEKIWYKYAKMLSSKKTNKKTQKPKQKNRKTVFNCVQSQLNSCRVWYNKYFSQLVRAHTMQLQIINGFDSHREKYKIVFLLALSFKVSFFFKWILSYKLCLCLSLIRNGQENHFL